MTATETYTLSIRRRYWPVAHNLLQGSKGRYSIVLPPYDAVGADVVVSVPADLRDLLTETLPAGAVTL